MELSEIISRCKKQERRAQNTLFRLYAPRFNSLCLRYMGDVDLAEDMLVQGFYKIFDKLNTFSGSGSFEGWMRRIIINECLMELRKRKNFSLTIPIEKVENKITVEIEDNLSYHEVLGLLDHLPPGYRTVFNLYAIEGFKHREIAEKLGISINTSKSQLILARRKLQQLIKKKLALKTA